MYHGAFGHTDNDLDEDVRLGRHEEEGQVAQVTQCDVCKKVADVDRPIMQERSISLRESIPKGGSTGFRVDGEWVKFHYYFTLPTGEYHSPTRIDICDECAGRGRENAYRVFKD